MHYHWIVVKRPNIFGEYRGRNYLISIIDQYLSFFYFFIFAPIQPYLLLLFARFVTYIHLNLIKIYSFFTQNSFAFLLKTKFFFKFNFFLEKNISSFFTDFLLYFFIYIYLFELIFFSSFFLPFFFKTITINVWFIYSLNIIVKGIYIYIFFFFLYM